MSTFAINWLCRDHNVRAMHPSVLLKDLEDIYLHVIKKLNKQVEQLQAKLNPLPLKKNSYLFDPLPPHPKHLTLGVT